MNESSDQPFYNLSGPEMRLQKNRVLGWAEDLKIVRARGDLGSAIQLLKFTSIKTPELLFFSGFGKVDFVMEPYLQHNIKKTSAQCNILEESRTNLFLAHFRLMLLLTFQSSSQTSAMI